MFKQVVFTPRIIVFNESFVSVGKFKMKTPFAALWHETISGWKQADITSTFHSFFLYARDYKNVVVWADNCAGQNKNWCLYSFLIQIINSNEILANRITIKYFETGHTFMTAGVFHRELELRLKQNLKVYDFQDFASVVRKCNYTKTHVKEMTCHDFRKWESTASLHQLQKINVKRLLLRDVVEITAKRGFRNLFYKTSHNGTDEELNFLNKRQLWTTRKQW